jgi:hypothetical protein
VRVDRARTAALPVRVSSTTASARNTSRPMPSPSSMVIPGARNFSGVSTNEIASTIPSQTTGTAICETSAPLTPHARPSGF